MPLTTGTRLGSYEIVSLIGAGGMGEVYKARDPRLDRQVALKRPSDEWLKSADAGTRLRREARAAARLNHPNIAAIYDVLDVDDRPHIVMEHVEGETLAACVARGPLPPARVVNIGMQLADALIDAHENGVVHRDLKPGNVILMPSGRVKVLDFGLARVSAGTESDRVTLTDPGKILGTPAYMAPEQLLGHRADERSDLYSAGVLLFELLTGRLPFEGPDAMARALAAVTGTRTPRADEVQPAVPAELADVVARAMARDPDDRFQTAREFRSALVRVASSLGELPTVPVTEVARRDQVAPRRGWVIAAMIAGLLVVGALAARPWLTRRDSPSGAPTVMAIAVLPFVHLGADAGDPLGLGFAESVITDLSRIPGATVIPRSEVVELAKDRNPHNVARALGANLIVDSTIQKTGDELRVSVNLVQPDGAKVFTKDYTGTADRILDLQRRVAAGIAAGAGLRTPPPPDTAAPQTADIGALASYWQGRAFLDRHDVAGNLVKAYDAFQAALARDPAFGEARAALGEAAWRRYQESRDPKWVDIALAESERAVKDKPAMPDAYVSLARVYTGTARTKEAIDALDRAVQLQPTHDHALEQLGETLVRAGQVDEGIAKLRDSIRLRPSFPRHRIRLGIVYFNLGRFDDAIQEFRQVTELQPDNATGFHILGTAYQAKGEYRLALESYGKVIAIAPRAETLHNMGAIHFEQKEYRDAENAYAEAVRLRPKEPHNHRSLGDAYRRQGRTDEARAAYTRAAGLAEDMLKVDPTDTGALTQLAVLLAKLGRFREAQQRAGQALTLKPNDPTVLYRRTIVLSLAGSKTEALASLEAALARGYSATLAAKDEDLEAIRDLPEFSGILQKARKTREGGSP